MSENTDRANPKPPSLDRLSQLWRRVNDYKIAQWSVAYIALAYGVQHGVILTSESFEWPRLVARISMLLLALGLPLVMTLAWYHGERASRQFTKAELSILSALLIIGSLLFYAFVRPTEEVAAGPKPAVQQASVAAARAASATVGNAISIAVLPFTNLSSDKEQEFFSDGMTEEITAALAKVPDLRVVARTSAFEFKGKNVDIGKIGEQLHATHLIEGSVRKAGNRLRITAQLIKADDGTHIWAEDYDRDLTDVFAIQEDIARAITVSLHMTLNLKPGENLVNNRNIDLDSYEKFLRAKALFEGRLGTNNPIALTDQLQLASLLEEVIAKNSTFAPAWSYLAAGYFLQAGIHAQSVNERIDGSRAFVDSLRNKAVAAAQRATELDPELAEPYATLGDLKWSEGKLVEADALLTKALTMDPDSVGTIGSYGNRIGAAGRIREGLALHEKAHVLEPLYPLILVGVARYRAMNGDYSGAIALAKAARPVNRATLLAMIYASLGRFAEAADALNEIIDGPSSPAAQAAQLLRNRPAKVPAEKLPHLPGNLEFAYLYSTAPERAIASYVRAVDAGFVVGGTGDRVWYPAYAPVRRTAQFKALMRKAGYVDYWRVKGWPEQCHPTTGDDFVCN